MATPTLTDDFTTMTDCSTTTGWTGSTPTVENDLYKEGSSCMSFTMRTIGWNTADYTKPTGNWDLSDTHIRMWFNSFHSPLWAAGNAMQIYVSDGTNTGYWNMLTKTTYDGGWVCLVMDTTYPFDSNSGTDPTMTTITKIGIRVNMASAPKRIANHFVDIIRFGSGITINGGSSGDKVDFDDIVGVSENTTNAYGVFQKRAGVYFISGKVTFGGNSNTYIEDSSKIVVWEDKQVQDDLYQWIFAGTSETTTDYRFGGITTGGGDRVTKNGCVFAGQNSSTEFRFIITDDDVDFIGIYGCSFIYQGQMDLGPASPTLANCCIEITNCTWASCGSVYMNFNETYSYFDQNTVSGGTDIAGIIAIEWPDNVLDLTVLDCVGPSANGRGIDFQGGSTYTLENAKFSGNTKDVYFSSTSGSVLNVIDSETQTWGYQTGVVNTVNEKTNYDAKVLNAAGAPINQARLWMLDAQDNVQVNALTNTSGEIASQVLLRYSKYYNGVGPALTSYSPMTLRVRKYDYLPYEISKTISSQGLEDTHSMQSDVVATTAEGTVSGWGEHFSINEATSPVPTLELSTSSHTLKECYEFFRYYTAQSGNMDLEDAIYSVDGVTFYIDDYDFEVDGVGLTGSSLILDMPTRDFYTINYGYHGLKKLTDIDGTQVLLLLQNVEAGSQCSIHDENGLELMNKAAVGSGKVEVSENYVHTVDLDLTIAVRKASSSPKFKPFTTGGTVTSDGYTGYVIQEEDLIA